MGTTNGPLPPMLPTQVGGNASFPARLAPLAGSQSVPLALPPGARVVAEVVQSQTDGQVLLRLGQTLLAATLPGQHQVGEQLPLIVLSEPGAQPALLLAPQNAAPATQSELSSTAQLLARIQQQPAQALRAAEPLWPQPDCAASAGLAQALADGVRHSGLFYESHLAAWVQGELPAQALLQEPQGRLSTLAQAQPPGPGPNAAATGASASAASTAAAAPGHGSAAPAGPGAAEAGSTGGLAGQVGQTGHAGQSQAQSAGAAVAAGTASAGSSAPPAHAAAGLYASMQAQASAAAAPAPGTTLQAMPAQLQALVQQQLATLAQGAVVWAGQAWPGQELEWRIEPDDTPGQQPGEAPQRSWSSVLRLDLPHLGPMVVTLQLAPGTGARQHLRVRVEHGQQAGAALQSQGLQFRQALEQAGLSLDELALRPLGASAHG
ncbi:flagellar hook-length control protein FliK [Thiomonas sp. FB-6]|uniref:flagellar hook-length control protein FliK n=1 Tax=Thiomonas sp. FB-6 TaxID=1158291 RepID=UPI000373DCDF|nr:flagellar hook-length control protein FliK [Thiomonas sp. FB-6]